MQNSGLRALIVVTVAFVIAFLFACSSRTLQPKGKLENVSNTLDRYPGEQVFEVRDEWEGSSYMNGEILDFRLFKDGTIEFDDYPTADELSVSVKASDVAIRKRSTISPSTLEELQSLITRPDFLKLKSEYKKLTISCDSAYNRTIVLEAKTVRIPQWCGVQTPPEFPQPIYDLFTKIRAIKKEKLGKDLPTP